MRLLHNRLGYAPPGRLLDADVTPSTDIDAFVHRFATEAMAGASDPVREPVAVFFTGARGGWKHAAIELLCSSLLRHGGVAVVDPAELSVLLGRTRHAGDESRRDSDGRDVSSLISQMIAERRHIMIVSPNKPEPQVLALRAADYAIHVVSALDEVDDVLQYLLDARDDARTAGAAHGSIVVPPRSSVSFDCMNSIAEGIALARARGVASMAVVSRGGVSELSAPALADEGRVRAAFGLTAPTQSPTPDQPVPAPAKQAAITSDGSPAAAHLPGQVRIAETKAQVPGAGERTAGSVRKDPAPQSNQTTSPPQAASSDTPQPKSPQSTRIPVPRPTTRRPAEAGRVVPDAARATGRIPEGGTNQAPDPLGSVSLEDRRQTAATLGSAPRPASETRSSGGRESTHANDGTLSQASRERIEHRSKQIQRLFHFAKIPLE